ncbi:hypothetical protein AB6E39_15645 [Vibrio splendidus]|uniref:hypothetical protein n=1 Tax=Vibrio TaxID=662 RepID=UPI000C8673B3|nr:MULTISPECIES: hypothetical protein [Vibrio]MCC4789367.1 hypothetical protein [Vibrio splendidus]PMN40114.1 hypothetical protein BCT34_03025 [Vibrio sp. 10N.261.45.E2]PMN47382.1 hypothetical protein BCT32_10360 [Vibrio sp. 10N.261.45.E11]CAK1933377.1 conserved hypothetical protein [Vibrio crassostreae]
MKHPTLNTIANICFFAMTFYLLLQPSTQNWILFDVLSLFTGKDSEGFNLYLLIAIHWLLYAIIFVHVKDVARYGSMTLAIQHAVEEDKKVKSEIKQ